MAHEVTNVGHDRGEGLDGCYALPDPIKRVSTEMSLHVLAYNLKRVIAILGVETLVAAIRA